jgi:DNA-binding IclR family transcriptional regulator
MHNESTDKYLINSILRAGNVLKCLAEEKTHLKISEVARKLQLDRSTAYRILLSLEKCGLVHKDDHTKAYTLGMAAFEIGNVYINQMDYIQVSKPVMAELAKKVRQTVHLAVLSGSEVVYVDKADSPRSLSVMYKIGQKAPLYCTALGKVLLAYQPEGHRNRIVDRIDFRRFTSNTILSKKKLLKELVKIRHQGYAVDFREYEDGVECIAAPILNHRGEIVAAMSYSGPQQKIDTPQEKLFVNHVVNAAARISKRLGYKEGE